MITADELRQLERAVQAAQSRFHQSTGGYYEAAMHDLCAAEKRLQAAYHEAGLSDTSAANLSREVRTLPWLVPGKKASA